MRFTPHGTTEMFLIDDLLLVHAVGPFNREGIVEYFDNLSVLIGEGVGSFSKIIVLDGLALLTPDAEVLIVNEIENLKDKGLSMIAVFTKKSADACVVVSQFSNIFIRAGVTYTFFNSLEYVDFWLSIKRDDVNFSVAESVAGILSEWMKVDVSDVLEA